MDDPLSAKRPSSQARPALELYFNNIEAIKDIDFGIRLSRVRYACMVNGGYLIEIVLNDPHFNVIGKFLEARYLQTARNGPVTMLFRLLASKEGGQFPNTATTQQIGYITKIVTYGTGSDKSHVSIVAVDPASYLLNRGAGSGKSYQGKVSNVIKQVIGEYAPEISLEIGETNDSDKNRFWMMRQDPQTFISSLLDWSSAVTKNKTQMIVTTNNMSMYIKEQADYKPAERAYYAYWERGGIPSHDSILGWELVTENSLSIVQNTIITQGLSSVSGAYLDQISDPQTAVSDSTTTNKVTATTTVENAFTKPGQGLLTLGISSVPTVPEIYSAGELGLQYDQYIDGTARDIWLNLARYLMRCRFRVLGHGEWSSGLGLGVDSIKVDVMQAPRNDNDNPSQYFLSGNWLVYGFEHDLSPGRWYTDVYAARFDWNASGKHFPPPTKS